MAFVCIGTKNKVSSSCTSVFSFIGIHNIDSITTLECSVSIFCFDSKSNRRSGAIDEFNKKYQLDSVIN